MTPGRIRAHPPAHPPMNLFLSLLSILVLAAMAAAFIGARLPKTHHAVSRIRLSATPEQVWAVILDFTAYPEWRPGLDRVELGPECGGLPSWFEVCGRLGRVHFQVVECAAPRRLVTQIDNDGLPLAGAWTYEFEPDGTGTLLTLTEWESIHHPLLRFFDRFVLSYHGVMDVYLTALARKLGDPAHPQHLSLKLDDA
ncbi:Polyketide cyclase / dehydrase and lipid transport [Methylomagnum ishizawai]|uniref:Polyketide cyclase / dehydrase and lipid transport n=2 Tax=Methylomagnum ishizawai TaxID=1760988 RepID=A0A1Y6CU82_9GAMM|nr:Polyketide cyclase / dehydrase and lipid transport [Methylomagnum ishizawai]